MELMYCNYEDIEQLHNENKAILEIIENKNESQKVESENEIY